VALAQPSPWIVYNQMKKNKPTPKTPLATSDNLTPTTTTTPQAKKKQAQKPTTKKKKQEVIESHLTKYKLIPTPLGAQEVASHCHITHIMDRVLTLYQLYEKTEECHLV
jgi:hypothetical protein